MNIKPIFKWCDFWVGWYWDSSKRRLYILPIPMAGIVISFDANKPKRNPDEDLALKVAYALSHEMMYKADCFDYLCWLEETLQRDRLKDVPLLILASDGTTCWGDSYSDCVKVAMQHDKELFDAVKQLELQE